MPAAIYLIDDDASFLRSAARLLRAAGHTVHTYGLAQDFLAQLGPGMAGCVIVDLQMPGLNGLELQESLSRTDNPLPVIFLTGQGDIPATVRAMRLGAEDFLTKRASKEQLFQAVNRALARDAREREQREKLRELRTRFDSLSPREREVLGHVMRGELNKQIAAALGVNERTVKLRRTSITRKLNVRSVA